MQDRTSEILLASLAAHRLAIFTGAGLSLPMPSSVPSARNLAMECSSKHEELTHTMLDPLVRDDLNAVASYFYDLRQLTTYFVERLVDWAPFRRTPNAGHRAIADLLSCNAAEICVSANVDVLVERAAAYLGNATFDQAITAAEANLVRPHKPLLKLHGCCERSRARTLWCLDQLAETYWQHHVDEVSATLRTVLRERDLVFIGFWSDWAYLNEALTKCLDGCEPRTVVVVDPADASFLEAKASDLWNWAHRAGITFIHERQSGAEFLDELRQRYSRVFLSSVCAKGQTAFAASGDRPPDHRAFFAGLDTDSLYDLRRDMTGVPRDSVVTTREADPSHAMTGEFVLSLISYGANSNNADFDFNGETIRVLHCPGRPLTDVQAEFGNDFIPGPGPTLVACVGAFDVGGAPPHLVRGVGTSTILRPGAPVRWLSYHEAKAELQLTGGTRAP